MTRTALGYPEDPRRLGDEYRYSVRSDEEAFARRIPPPSHSTAYDRGNGSQYSQRPENINVRQEPIGSSTEQGRLFRPAIPRTEQRVSEQNKLLPWA